MTKMADRVLLFTIPVVVVGIATVIGLKGWLLNFKAINIGGMCGVFCFLTFEELNRKGRAIGLRVVATVCASFLLIALFCYFVLGKYSAIVWLLCIAAFVGHMIIWQQPKDSTAGHNYVRR